MILIRHHYNSDDDDDGVYISSPVSKYCKTTNENTNSNIYYDNTSTFYDNSSNTKHFNYAPHKAHDNDNDHK